MYPFGIKSQDDVPRQCTESVAIAVGIFNSPPQVPHICLSEMGQHWFR